MQNACRRNFAQIVYIFFVIFKSRMVAGMGEPPFAEPVLDCRPVPWAIKVTGAVQRVWQGVCTLWPILLPVAASANGLLHSSRDSWWVLSSLVFNLICMKSISSSLFLFPYTPYGLKNFLMTAILVGLRTTSSESSSQHSSCLLKALGVRWMEVM